MTPIDDETNPLEDQPAEETPRELPAEISPAEAREILRAGNPLENATVRGLQLRGNLDQPLIFRKCTLIDLHLSHGSLKEDVFFYSCTLVKPRIGGKLTLEKRLGFPGSELRRAALHDASIQGDVRLENATFQGHLRCDRLQIGGTLRLWEASFCGWADFREVEVRGLADLRSFRADQGLSFKACHFHGDFLLRGSSVAQKLDLGDSRFEALLDLSKAKLHDFVYLEDIQQGERQRFAFENMVGDKLRLTESQLAGRLAREECGEHVAAMNEYGLLKNIFQSLHRHQAEDWAYYRFKINARRARPSSWSHPWSKCRQFSDWLFLDVGCGYGVDPWRAVRAAIVLMLFFALIYTVAFGKFSGETDLLGIGQGDHFGNRIVFSLVKSVSVFTAGLAGEQLTSARGWVLIPLSIEALLGTLLWGLFIVAFSRKVIR